MTSEEGFQGDEGVGSTFAASGDLYRLGDRRNSVGRFGYSCVVTSVEEEEANCTATVDINQRRDDDGQITVQGLADGRRRQTFAITGGTDDFENAGGELRTFDVTNRITLLTFDFAD